MVNQIQFSNGDPEPEQEEVQEPVQSAKPASRAPARARRRPRTMTPEEIFLNTDVEDLVEDYDTSIDGDEATGTHSRPGFVQMWKPSGNGHDYTPRMVPAGNRAINLQNGWLPWCPQCRTNHEDSPYPAGDANSCPARNPVAVRICPVCRKRVTDNMAWVEQASDEDAPDADYILKDDSLTSSPESRTRMQLNIHLWTFHGTQARLMGIPPIPTGFSNPALPPDQGAPVATAVGM